MKDTRHWAVGLLRGKSLDQLSLRSNPIVSAAQLEVHGGIGAADPFAIFRSGVWYVFFEMFRPNSAKAVIGAARSHDLNHWEVLGTVLEQPHHLSYPFIFEYQDEVYMMPESKSVRRVDLYRASEFPNKWVFDRTIAKGRLADCSMVQHGGLYWLFAGWHSYWLKLYYAQSPLGPWRHHWMPFARTYSKSSTRPGGRPVHWNNQLVRFSQDNKDYYGQQLRAWSVTHLSRLWYSDVPLCKNPVLQGTGIDSDWNGRCMHHIDPFIPGAESGLQSCSGIQDEIIAFVDGMG